LGMQLLEDSVEERMEKALSDSDKTEAESKDADAEDNNKARYSLIVWEPCCTILLRPLHRNMNIPFLYCVLHSCC
jgi:hypothetical protein